MPPVKISRFSYENDYLQLIKHLVPPEKVALSHFQSKVSQTNITKYATCILNNSVYSYWSRRNIAKVSHYAMVGLSKGYIPLSVVSSLHMRIAVVDEFILNPTFRATDYKANPQLKMLHFKAARSEIQNFFNLNDREWNVFAYMMDKEIETEQYFCYVDSPEDNFSPKNWSPLYAEICALLACLQPIRLFHNSTKLDGDLKVLIPSFSMLQNFFKLKASINNRTPLQLVPIMGELTAEDVYSMKKQEAMPLGLYMPSSIARLRGDIPPDDINKKYMKSIHNYTQVGSWTFLMHDAYHLAAEQEMSEKHSAARHYIVSYLKSLIDKGCLKEDFELTKEAVLLLQDGGFHFSYPLKNSLFQNRPSQAEKFGTIFSHYITWPFIVKLTIIKDMIDHPLKWSIRYGLDDNCLMDEDRKLTQVCTFLRNRELGVAYDWDTKNFNFLTPVFEGRSGSYHVDEVNEIPHLFEFKNSKITRLTCISALLDNCRVKNLQASRKLILKNCPDLGFINAQKDIYVENCLSIKSIIAKKNIVLDLETFSKIKGKIEAKTIYLSCAGDLQQKGLELILDQHMKCKTFVPPYGTEKIIVSKNCHIERIKFLDQDSSRQQMVFIDKTHAASSKLKVIDGNLKAIEDIDLCLDLFKVN
ncbi:MAG: hypothetical protein K0S74_1167 [Chlamydiales bacterium]|jgi:hypothetical protein|nr:hypothetical protein [Chlamydiales bacterium]